MKLQVVAPLLLKHKHQTSGTVDNTEKGYADSLKADASPLSEVLNLAWAMHEITDEYLTEVNGSSTSSPVLIVLVFMTAIF